MEQLKKMKRLMEVLERFPQEKKLYMAGKLFSEADQEQRKKEYSKIMQFHADNRIERKIFTPVFAPVNDKSKLVTSEQIFSFDESELMTSDVVFVDLTDADGGTLMESGMVLYFADRIYPYISDIRIANAGKYDGIQVPFGYNQFVIGGLEKYFGKIHMSFDEALEAYKKDELNE